MYIHWLGRGTGTTSRLINKPSPFPLPKFVLSHPPRSKSNRFYLPSRSFNNSQSSVISTHYLLYKFLIPTRLPQPVSRSCFLRDTLPFSLSLARTACLLFAVGAYLAGIAIFLSPPVKTKRRIARFEQGAKIVSHRPTLTPPIHLTSPILHLPPLR